MMTELRDVINDRWCCAVANKSSDYLYFELAFDIAHELLID